MKHLPHFLCTEVIADATKSVDAVLKADTKRLELLEEEKKILVEVNKGSTKLSERLQEVGNWFNIYIQLL